MDIDYKALLEKYMRHVTHIEGWDYIDDWDYDGLDPNFTEHENSVLFAIRARIRQTE